MKLFWEHPSSPGANASLASHTARLTERGPGSAGGTPRQTARSRPAARGAPGSAGVGGRRHGAGPGPGMSSASPPGVAGRLHQTPSGVAARASSLAGPSRASRPSAAGAGFPRAGPAPRQAAGAAAASSSPLAGRQPRPPYLRLQPARPLGGLHSERPRAARPEPTQASQPASQRGRATVTKPVASARSAAAATGFPASPGPRAPPPPFRPMGAPACGRHCLLSRRAALSTNREPHGYRRRARGRGVGSALLARRVWREQAEASCGVRRVSAARLGGPVVWTTQV
ncbi:uncharacterized protein LOC144580766 [Callithrix jacchus]